MGWPAWASAGRGAIQNAEYRRQQDEDAAQLSHLERLPDAPIEGVDAVLVAPQNPRETIALIEFEQDDLVAIRRCEAARIGQRTRDRTAV